MQEETAGLVDIVGLQERDRARIAQRHGCLLSGALQSTHRRAREAGQSGSFDELNRTRCGLSIERE